MFSSVNNKRSLELSCVSEKDKKQKVAHKAPETLLDLPPDLLVNILEFVPKRELFTIVSTINRYFHSISLLPIRILTLGPRPLADKFTSCKEVDANLWLRQLNRSSIFELNICFKELSPGSVISINKLHLHLNELLLFKIPDLSDNALLHFKDLKLKKLSIFDCDKITDAGLKGFSQCPLEELELINLQISGMGLKYFQPAKLKRLTLQKSSIKDQYISELNPTYPLVSLNLSGTLHLSEQSLKNLNKYKLEVLDLSDCNWLTDIGVSYLSKLSLKELNFSQCSRITISGLKHLEKLPLKYLHLPLRFKNKEVEDWAKQLREAPELLF